MIPGTGRWHKGGWDILPRGARGSLAWPLLWGYDDSMTRMNAGDSANPQRARPFQFDLRTALAVTAIVALSTAAIVGRASLVTLVLAAVAVPVLAAAVCEWNRWSWRIGLVLLLVLSMLATPADPLSMWLFAIPACVVYVLSVLAWKAMRKRRTDRAEHGPDTRLL